MKHTIQKSLLGTYEDNDFNRRLGRVGQKYDHSSGHIIIDSILISLKDEINSMIERSISNLQKEYDKVGLLQTVSSKDAEYIRIEIISDMSIALSKYLKPTDKLLQASKRSDTGGSIEVSIDIERDGKNHKLLTEMIYAGGYNIQKLHYRYITKTDLPSLNNEAVKKSYKDKVAKLTKADKILKEIDYYESVIKRQTLKIEESKTITEEQILDKNNYWNTSGGRVTWKEIVERGADEHYEYKEENFIESQKQFRQSLIDNYYNGIELSKNILVGAMKDKLKQEQKLKAL